MILTSLEEFVIEQVLRFNFNTFNNGTEYEALMMDLRMIKDFEVRKVKIFTDSQLIVDQIWGQFEVKDSTIACYLQNIKKLSKNFEELEVLQISKSKNIWVDALSHLATFDFFELNQKVLIE